MGRKKTHTPEAIVAKLRQVEVLTAQGKAVSDLTLEKVLLKEAASGNF